MPSRPHPIRRRRLRTATRVAALAAVLVVAAGLLPWEDALALVPAVSPFVASASALATRAVGVLSLAAAPVLVLALLRRRWFCRWACPVGLVSETLGRLRSPRRGGSQTPPRGDGGSGHGAAGAPRLRSGQAPTRRASRGRGPRLARRPAVGQWMLLATLGGACLGYPMLVWLDPLGMVTAAVGAWFRPLGLVTVLATAPLAAVVAVSVLAPGAWCGRLCPLGGMQDLLALAVRRLRGRTAARAETPDAVPAPVREAAPAGEDGRTVGRRFFLGVGAGGVAALVTEVAGRGAEPPIRPPGAADEKRFVGLCLRCGNCVRACPSRILKPDLGQGGAAGFLAPRAVFDAGYCREDCNACGRVCPSGAIARLSLQEKCQQTMGVAQVDLDKCLMAGGHHCEACIVVCPYEAVEQVDPEGSYPAYPYPRVVVVKCVGCGACELECPIMPPKAIRVRPDAGALADRV